VTHVTRFGVSTAISLPRRASPSKQRESVSIVVCTRNRAEKLRHTLNALASLWIPEECECEFLVVDNGSTDHTARVCEDSRRLFARPLRRIYVTAPGLSEARNAGLRAAQGSVIAYADDDVRPNSRWLEAILREFLEDPGLGVLSGRVELFNPADLPHTLRLHTERATFNSMGHAFSLLAGCNFALRRSLVQRVGLFDEEFGTGARFGSAEDADFFYRAWKQGERLVFAPEMLVYHDHGRRTAQDGRDLVRAYISGRGAFYAKHICLGDSQALRGLYWELRSAIRGAVRGNSDFGWKHAIWLVSGALYYFAVFPWIPKRKGPQQKRPSPQATRTS